METVQQNGCFTLFSNKFLSIYSILYGCRPECDRIQMEKPERLLFQGGFRGYT